MPAIANRIIEAGSGTAAAAPVEPMESVFTSIDLALSVEPLPMYRLPAPEIAPSVVVWWLSIAKAPPAIVVCAGVGDRAGERQFPAAGFQQSAVGGRGAGMRQRLADGNIEILRIDFRAAFLDVGVGQARHEIRVRGGGLKRAAVEVESGRMR